jgi:hypothetical protein
MDTDVATTVSLCLSILATASSVVLWFVQLYEKQPKLRAHWINLNRFRGHIYGCTDAEDVQPLLLRLAVANHSASPDALLDVRFRVRSRDGVWLPSRPYLYLAGCASDVTRHLDRVTALPMNLPPKQTVPLCRYLQIALPKGADFEAVVGEPLEVEVELLSLSGRRFRNVIVKPEGLDELSEATAEELV